MKAMFLSLGLFLAVISTTNAQIADPVQNYSDMRTFQERSEIMRLDADINGDGQKVIFLSKPEALNGKAGNIWSVYVPTTNGFKRLPQPITFRADAFVVDVYPSLGRKALLAYQPGGGGGACLVAFWAEDGGIKEKVCENIVEEQGRSVYAERALAVKSTSGGIQRIRVSRPQEE